MPKEMDRKHVEFDMTRKNEGKEIEMSNEDSGGPEDGKHSKDIVRTSSVTTKEVDAADINDAPSGNGIGPSASGTENIAPVAAATDAATERADSKQNFESSDDEFCTAPDETQSQAYSTAREESQGTAASLNDTSPTVLHDGNTVKKADRPEANSSMVASKRRETCVFDVERSPESMRALAETSKPMARPSAATLSSNHSPIVVHDGFTVRKVPLDAAAAVKDTQPSKSMDQGDVSFLESNNLFEDNDDIDPTPRRSGVTSTMPAAGAAMNETASEGTAAVDNPETNKFSAPKLGAAVGKPALSTPATKDQRGDQRNDDKPIVKGTIVNVLPRTWPGINKPGGVARVTKVYPASTNGNNSIRYDVAYVLGGKEKLVDESFVTVNEPEVLETIDEEGPNDSMVSRGGSAEKKSRTMRRRKAATKQEANRPAAPNAVLPIYNDEELKEIPKEHLIWAGILPQEKKGKNVCNKAVNEKRGAEKRGKKRVLKEASNNADAKSKQTSIKRQKAPASKQTRTILCHV